MGRYVRGTAGFAFEHAPHESANLPRLAQEAGVGRCLLLPAVRYVGPQKTTTRALRLPIPLSRTDGDDEVFARFYNVAIDVESRLLRHTERFARGELISAELVARAEYSIDKRRFPRLVALVRRHLPPRLRWDVVADHEPAREYLVATHAAAGLPLLALEMLVHAARHHVSNLVVTEEQPSLCTVLSLRAIAWKLYETGRLEILREIVRRREHVKYGEDHVLVAQFLQFDNRFEEAFVEADRAVALSPKNASWTLQRAIQRHFCKDFCGALADYDRAAALWREQGGPDDDEDAFHLHRNRGEVHLDLGDPRAALDDLLRAARLQPDPEVDELIRRARAA